MELRVKIFPVYFKRDATEDPRRYNKPKIGEIAIIFDGEMSSLLYLILWFIIKPKLMNLLAVLKTQSSV